MRARAASSSEAQAAPHAAIVYLSGSLRGTSYVLREERATIGSAAGDVIRIAEGNSSGCLHATLRRRGPTYELCVADGVTAFVNGERVTSRVLTSGDVLEFGDSRAVLRFRLYPAARGPYKTLSEAFSDCIDCARYGGGGIFAKAAILAEGLPGELATQVAPRTRWALASIMVATLAIASASLWRGYSLERRLLAEADRIQGLEAVLARTESAVFTRDDLNSARAEIEDLIDDSLRRVEALEERADAPGRAIAAAAESVLFLQGGFGFVDPPTGRPLRYAVGSGGRPLRLPDGSSPVTLEGDGPVVEVLFTGTGFVASASGHVLTNRHVAQPWLRDESAQAAVRRGFAPVMRRFVAYVPGVDEPFDLLLVAASETADIALLRLATPTLPPLHPLLLAARMPQAGDDVIVMGYPTGMRAVIARAGGEFAQTALAEGQLDFWQAARKLAEGGYLQPLATRGIVGQLTEEAVVYDAATVGGGSGGPVLDVSGRVVAVNTAIIPGFGGSNLGVPASEATALLEAAR